MFVHPPERLPLRWVFQAVMDFGFDASEIFQASPDDVKDIAEDITRELLDWWVQRVDYHPANRTIYAKWRE